MLVCQFSSQVSFMVRPQWILINPPYPSFCINLFLETISVCSISYSSDIINLSITFKLYSFNIMIAAIIMLI